MRLQGFTPTPPPIPLPGATMGPEDALPPKPYLLLIKAGSQYFTSSSSSSSSSSYANTLDTPGVGPDPVAQMWPFCEEEWHKEGNA